VFKHKYGATENIDKPIVDRAAELADKYGVPIPCISLAWLMQKETVAAPVIGATKLAHIEQAVEALSVKLTAEDVAYLEELYVPHKVVGAL
jgi:aryl-alcohol dehydrogenase-like predicted oxidoreductase